VLISTVIAIYSIDTWAHNVLRKCYRVGLAVFIATFAVGPQTDDRQQRKVVYL